MLSGHQLKVGQTQCIGQRVEVVLFGQPGCEVVGFMFPGFAQGDAFEFAERFFMSGSCQNAIGLGILGRQKAPVDSSELFAFKGHRSHRPRRCHGSLHWPTPASARLRSHPPQSGKS